MKRNPPWVDRVLQDAAGDIAEAPPAWAPLGPGRELGCGRYGCVVPTATPGIVLKITTDDTEAEFAFMLAGDLVAPICIKYHRVVKTMARHEGKDVYLLWRDVAFDVGKVEETLGELAADALARQHASAQLAYWAAFTKQPTPVLKEAIDEWTTDIGRMARSRKFPAIRRFGEGLVAIWEQQHILFGDIHSDNVGFRDGDLVVIDPGHIAVISPSALTG